jgi:hypothetical protein
MKKQLVVSAFTTLMILTALPAFASEDVSFKDVARAYHHAYISSFHNVKEAKCTEIYENGEEGTSSFEFKRKGHVVTATQHDQDEIRYKFTPSMWKSSYVAHGERNGSKFMLHARETVDGDFIIKMTTRAFGLFEHAMGYISCTPEK